MVGTIGSDLCSVLSCVIRADSTITISVMCCNKQNISGKLIITFLSTRSKSVSVRYFLV